MKDMTKWEQKGRNTAMSSSGPKKRAGRRMAGSDGGKRAGRRTNGRDAKAGCGSDSKAGGDSKASSGGDSNLMKAGLAVAAGLIVAALAKGVKDSDYYD